MTWKLYDFTADGIKWYKDVCEENFGDFVGIFKVSAASLDDPRDCAVTIPIDDIPNNKHYTPIVGDYTLYIERYCTPIKLDEIEDNTIPSESCVGSVAFSMKKEDFEKYFKLSDYQVYDTTDAPTERCEFII